MGGNNIQCDMSEYNKEQIEALLQDNIGKKVVVNICPYPQSPYLNWIQIIGYLNTYEMNCPIDGTRIAFHVGEEPVVVNFEMNAIRDAYFKHDRLMITLDGCLSHDDDDDSAGWWKNFRD